MLNVNFCVLPQLCVVHCLIAFLSCRYVLMQASTGATSEVAATGKAAQPCITELSKAELLVSQDTSSLFLGDTSLLCCMGTHDNGLSS